MGKTEAAQDWKTEKKRKIREMGKSQMAQNTQLNAGRYLSKT